MINDMDWKQYKKEDEKPVWASQLPRKVKIITICGDIEAEKGDFLVIGIGGVFTGVKKEFFEEYYKEVEEDGKEEA
jgi:hypothetical protein